MADIDSKAIREQGREAKRLNDEENHVITEHNCPYGPAEAGEPNVATTLGDPAAKLM